MADRRRRRRKDETEDEDSEQIVTKDEKTPTVRRSECESEDEGPAPDEKPEVKNGTEESKSKDPTNKDEDDDEEEDSEEDSDEEGSDDEEDDEDDEYDDVDVVIEDDGSWVEEERQSGDGEEQTDQQKELDDDEDRKNPAFIPRRGAFYEHDTRMGAQEKEMEEQCNKKKLWKENDRWIHDRFQQDEQAPKSREELIALYGYDIRACDKPPDHAPSFRGQGRRFRKPYRKSELGDFVEKNSRNFTNSTNNQQNDIVEMENRPPPKYRSYDNKPPEYRLPYGSTEDNDNYDNYKGQRAVSNRKFDVRSQFDRFQKQRNLVDKVGRASHLDSKTNQSELRSNQSELRSNQSESRSDQSESRSDQSESRSDQSESRTNQSESRTNQSESRTNQSELKVNQPELKANQQELKVNQPELKANQPEVLMNQSESRDNRFDSQSQDMRNQNFVENRSESRPGGYQNQHARTGSRNQAENTDYRNDSNWRGSNRNRYDRPLRSTPDRSEPQAAHYQTEYTDRRTDSYRGRGRNLRRGRGANSRADIAPRYSRMQNCAASYVASGAPQREFVNSSYHGDDPKMAAADTEVDERSESQDVIISNRDRMISVTITNTTTEKKSYVKDQHPLGKEGASEGKDNSSAAAQEPPAPSVSFVTKTESGQQIRPKRYSSQRQRTTPDPVYTGYPPSPAYHPDRVAPVAAPVYQHPPERVPPAPAPVFQHPPDRVPPSPGTVFQHSPDRVGPAPPVFHPERVPVSAPDGTFQTTILQPPVAFTLPVSSAGLSSPPRVYTHNVRAPNVSIAAPTRLITPQYITGGVVYGSPPPPPGPYQMPVAFPTPPTGPPPPAPAPVQTAAVQGPPPSGPPAGPEVYRGGTTYYAPELQRLSSRRSPTRRPKLAIPIVKPEDRPKGSKIDDSSMQQESVEGLQRDTGEGGQRDSGEGGQQYSVECGQQKWKQSGDSVAETREEGSQSEYTEDVQGQNEGWAPDDTQQPLHNTSTDSVTDNLPNTSVDITDTSLDNISDTSIGTESEYTREDPPCDTQRQGGQSESDVYSHSNTDIDTLCAAGEGSEHKESEIVENISDENVKNRENDEIVKSKESSEILKINENKKVTESGENVKSNVSVNIKNEEIEAIESDAVKPDSLPGQTPAEGDESSIRLISEIHTHAPHSANSNTDVVDEVSLSHELSTRDSDTRKSENVCDLSVCIRPVEKVFVIEENKDSRNHPQEEGRHGAESDTVYKEPSDTVYKELTTGQDERKVNSDSHVLQTEAVSAASANSKIEYSIREITCDGQDEISNQMGLLCDEQSEIISKGAVICAKQGEITHTEQGEINSDLRKMEEESDHRAPVVHEFVVNRQLKVEDNKPALREMETTSSPQSQTNPSFAVEQQTNS